MLDLKDYDIIPSEKVAASKILVDMWIKLGKPQDPLSTQGKKLMEILISTWQDLDPVEATKWWTMRSDYQENEMDLKDQVKKHTGRSLASYPLYIYRIMQKLFPSFDIGQRDNAIKMVRAFPIFRLARTI